MNNVKNNVVVFGCNNSILSDEKTSNKRADAKNTVKIIVVGLTTLGVLAAASAHLYKNTEVFLSVIDAIVEIASIVGTL